MFGDDDLLISEPLTKDLDGLLIVGRREGESGHSIKGCAVKEGSQMNLSISEWSRLR